MLLLRKQRITDFHLNASTYVTPDITGGMAFRPDPFIITDITYLLSK
jgi:hypothetical protein